MITESTDKIIEEIRHEVGWFPSTRWGKVPEEILSVTAWVTLITHYATQVFFFDAKFATDFCFFRRQLVSTAAICVAAAQWCDRRIAVIEPLKKKGPTE